MGRRVNQAAALPVFESTGLPGRGSWAVDSGPGFPLWALPLPCPIDLPALLGTATFDAHGKQNVRDSVFVYSVFGLLTACRIRRA